MQLAELDLQVAFLGHLQRVAHRLGDFGEAGRHLLRGSQVELLFGIPHPLRVGELGLGADADQAIVGVRVFFINVMHVVRRDELEAELPGPRDELAVDLGLFGQAVMLQLQVEVLRAERLLEPVNGLARAGELVLLDPIGNLARKAAGEGDQAVLVRRQQLLVNARLVIIALQVRLGGELDQVLVAGFVPGQQDEVMIRVPAAVDAFLLKPAAGGHINLAADDRLDAAPAGGLVEVNRAVERAVVGDRQGRKLERMRPLHEPVQPAGSIEQRILGVQVKVNKFRVRHSPTLPPRGNQGQAEVIHRRPFARSSGKTGSLCVSRRRRRSAWRCSGSRAARGPSR